MLHEPVVPIKGAAPLQTPSRTRPVDADPEGASFSTRCASSSSAPSECDKRGGGIAAELARLTSARVARVCAQSRSPSTTESTHEAGERLEPADSLAAARVEDGMGGCGKARMCGGSSPMVSGRVLMGSKALACLRHRRSWGMMSGQWGKAAGRECVPVWERRGCSHPGACSPLQARVLPSLDRDRSRLYRLCTTHPALMPAVLWPLSRATYPSLLTSCCSIADEAHRRLGVHSV